MARKDKLRCSVCLKKDYMHYLIERINYKTWLNVKIVKKIGQSFLCKCGNCGHEYKTNSSAAYRQFRAQGEKF